MCLLGLLQGLLPYFSQSKGVKVPKHILKRKQTNIAYLCVSVQSSCWAFAFTPLCQDSAVKTAPREGVPTPHSLQPELGLHFLRQSKL